MRSPIKALIGAFKSLTKALKGLIKASTRQRYCYCYCYCYHYYCLGHNCCCYCYCYCYCYHYYCPYYCLAHCYFYCPGHCDC